ncbi:hypothetical protein ABTD49_22195, partial [Acinetobacter baumannii]
MAASLTATHTVPVFAAGQTLSKAEYEGCQASDEQGFRKSIQDITEAALKRSMAGFDYKAAVNDQWRTLGMD